MSDTPAPLAELLLLAEWGPRQLVAAINARLSSQGRDRLRLDPTAGYSWVQRGFRPRPPIPDIAAAVLTDRLGYAVTVDQLWPCRDRAALIQRSAATGLDDVTHVDDLVRELSQLTTTAPTPRSPIADASGADLTATVLDQLRDAVLVARNRAGHEYVLPEQVELIGAHVAALRRLDDRPGGGALSRRYVTAELRNVVDLVEYANYDVATGQRLLAIVADLNETTVGSRPVVVTCRLAELREVVKDGGPRLRSAAVVQVHPPSEDFSDMSSTSRQHLPV